MTGTNETERKVTKYQFQIDGRGFGSPLRNTWEQAAQDAVNAGFATWFAGGVALDDQASIERLVNYD